MRARWIAVVVVVVVAVGVGAFFAGRASDNGTVTTPTVPITVSAPSFQPVSVTFVSTTTGWVLGTQKCSSGACLTMLQTTDQGRTWSPRHLPSALTAAADAATPQGMAASYSMIGGLNVRFADPANGWIYGSVATANPASGTGVVFVPVLWSTHDGGVAWHRQPLGWVGGFGTVFDVEAAAGTVHMMAPDTSGGVTVESSPVGSDHWRATSAVHLGLPGGGGTPSGTFVLHGDRGWLVVGNGRGTSGSAQLTSAGTWVAWTPPCSSVGDSFSAPVAVTSSDLVAGCTMGGFAQSLSSAAPPGATLGSTWLYFSRDGGQSFAHGPELGTERQFYDYSVLAAPTVSAILMGRGTYPGQLVASFDNGSHWGAVYPAQPSYLAFTTPTQGVALVQVSGSSSVMIMTFDGGRHWAKVAF